MAETDSVFSGSIPEIYDTYLVPLIFDGYARDIANRVAARDPRSVLETAAGSGVVSRALLPMLDSEARYVITDLNQQMIDRAMDRLPPDDRVSWQQSDALQLPFGDEVFDIVCCQFGVMFFPNRVTGFREARRVLAEGGAFVFNSWDRIEHNEFAEVVTQAASALFPADPPVFMARTPHGYHDTAVINADLRAAGFETIKIDTITDTSRAASPRDAALAFCQGTPLRNELEARDADGLERVTDAVEVALRQRFGDGPIEGKIQGHVVVASG